MLSLTAEAVEAIRAMTEDGDVGADGGLRISAAGVEEGEVELDFDLAPKPSVGDEILREGGASVFLDQTAADVLAEKTLDVHAHGDHVHFTIDD
jgi:iron-sulfur cluster assembly protein